MVQTDCPVFVCETYYVLTVSCILGCDIYKSLLFTWYTASYVTYLILSHFSPRFHLSAFRMPPLSPGSLALGATIGLIDHLGLALLVGCLPLPLSLRRTTARAFSGYCTVLGTRSLYVIQVIAVLVF